ncbi:MAG: PEGA domain-containing protein, partial [Nitrospinota bacterium]
DHEPETMKFKIDASEVKKLQFTLKKKKFGELEFVSNINGGQIFLDGKLLKRVSLSTVKNTVLKKIAEGKHRILIKKKNYHSFKTEVVLSDLKKTIVTIDLQPVKGSLDIFIDKEGTEIFLDEKSYGKTTSPNDTIALKSLTPGKYKLSGKLKGHITAEQPVEVRPGSNTKVKLVIKPGIFLSVKTSPAPSEILINGEKKGESPLLSPVQPGTVVRVRVILDGYRAPAMVFSMKKDREINIRLIKESAYTFYREGQKNEDIFEKLLLKQGGKKGENSKKLLGQYLKQARGLYKKATLEDPMYAMAYASLGRVLLRKLEKEKQDGKKGSSRNIVNTIVHSQKAIDLNNDLLAKAVALNVMGGINLFKGNQEGSGEKKITWYNEAVKSFDKAIAFFKSAEISMDYRSIDLAGAYYKRAIAFENIALNQKGGNQTFLYAACQAWKTFSFEGSHRSGSLSEKIMSAYRKTSTEHRLTFCQD